MTKEGFKIILKSLKPNQTIADLGSGLTRIWWHEEIKEGSTIAAFDVVYGESETPFKGKNFEKTTYYPKDISKLTNEEFLKERYDLIIAHNILEHVNDLNGAIKSINWISKKESRLHILVPNAEQPTDIFYRLIHKNSGGHIQKFKKDEIINLMAGWELIKTVKWFDDWSWFEKLYDPECNDRDDVTKEEIKILADILKKEINEEAGYYYGKEYIFLKKK